MLTYFFHFCLQAAANDTSRGTFQHTSFFIQYQVRWFPGLCLRKPVCAVIGNLHVRSSTSCRSFVVLKNELKQVSCLLLFFNLDSIFIASRRPAAEDKLPVDWRTGLRAATTSQRYTMSSSANWRCRNTS